MIKDIKLGIIQNTNINFARYYKLFVIISIILIILAIIFTFTKGYNLGVDFRGGVVIDLQSKENYNKQEIVDLLNSLQITNYSIRDFNNNSMQIAIGNNAFNNSSEVLSFTESFINSISANYTLLQTQFVGPTISEGLIKSGIYAIIFSFISIFLYLWARFDWQYGVIGIITLLHDVIVSFLFLSIFKYEISVSTIAAILMIIGYSINDTVVIFDQVRETTKQNINQSKEFIINKSINQVFSRSLATSITLLVVLISIFFIAGNALQSFSFTLFIGIFFGTYSSICIAALLLLSIGNIKARHLKQLEKEKLAKENKLQLP